jgi:hypothetical protein
MKKFAMNEKFLDQRVTEVQRAAMELTKELDKILLMCIFRSSRNIFNSLCFSSIMN